MSAPQLEDGYTKIANEILEAFARTPSLGSEAFQVLMLVLRRSYGFHRKDAEMTISFICKGTGLKHRSACRAVERLVSKRLIVRQESIVKFNKNYDEWVVSKRLTSVQTDTPPVSKRRTEVVSKRLTNKERVKDTPKKETVTKVTGATQRYEDGTKVILLKDEPMSQLDERDRSFPRKRVYGQEKYDWCLDYCEHLLGRSLTGQEKWNRIYARHLVNKWGVTKVKALLEFVCAPESWWFEKLGQMSTLYKNSERLVLEMENKKNGGENKVLVIS